MRSRLMAGVAGAGVSAGAYALRQARAWTLAHRRIPIRSGPALSVLHISDLHLTKSERALADWLGSLPGKLPREPDFVLVTGDLIDDNSGIELAAEALGRFEARRGCFYVLGSHDYYQSRFKFPGKYFSESTGQVRAPRAATNELEAALQSSGWVALTNRGEVVDNIRVAGVDDPYINKHSTDHIRRARSDEVAIGLTHAPDVVSEFILAGFDLVLAGHTHGGQVRFPVVGAAVTNCSLPTALAMGAHRIGNGWLHVSPGLGTSKFTPIRLNCPPEATLLHLMPPNRRPASMWDS